MTRDPLVSVIIPCFNQERFLAEAIESVLSQRTPADEIIVVDDGSSDGSRGLARSYPGVTVITQPNGGLSAARNRGLAESRGSFLLFLDADDRLLPDALEADLEVLSRHPNCAIAAGHCRIIDARGAIVAEFPQRVATGDLYLDLARGNFIAMPGTVMYRRASLEKLGGFDPAVDAAADYDLYLRVALHFGITVHDRVIGEYRRHDGNMSNDAALMLATTLGVLGRNRRRLLRIPGGGEAFLEGLSFWRDKYGGRLVHRALFALEQRKWRTAIEVALVLAKHDRQRLWLLARGVRESNTLSFVVSAAAPPEVEESLPEEGLAGGNPTILRLHPASTAPGVPFNVQANGESALCLRCRNVPADTVVMFNGEPLETTVGGPDLVTAIVPRDFFSTPGSFSVHLRTSR